MEKGIEKILVPYDFSDFSKKALDHAMMLALGLGSKISIITVIPSHSNPSPSKILGILSDDKDAQKGFHDAVCSVRINLKKELSKLVDSCKNDKVLAEYEIIEGHDVEEIIKFSKKENFDLVVMGSHGLTGLPKIQALGSVARAVSEGCSCPVLLVKN